MDPYSTTAPIAGLSLPGTGSLPSIAYPPMWAFMQAIVYDFYSIISVHNRFLYYFMIKQETIIPDIALGYLIYKVLSRHGRFVEAEKSLSFWMFCPFVIIISSVWGMFDQLALLLVLAALFAAGRTATSSLAESVGIFLKAIPIIFLPMLAWTQDTYKKRISYLLLTPAIAVILTLAPYIYFHSWSLMVLLSTGSSALSVPTNSMNYWVVAYILFSYSLLPAYVEPLVNAAGYFWIFALAAAYLLCLRKAGRNGFAVEKVIMILQFLTLVFFLTRIGISEQYLIYFLGFGLLERSLVGNKRSKLFAGVWASATGYLLANNTYLIRFLSPVSAGFLSADAFLSSGNLGLVRNGFMVGTALMFTLFCILYLRSLYSDIANNKAAPLAKAAP